MVVSIKPTSTTRPKRKPTKNKAQAERVLEIYSDGQSEPWKRVVALFPELKTIKRSEKDVAADALLSWAVGTVANDDVKQALAARVVQALAGIGFDSAGKATDRLNALKLLGQECGMFKDKPEPNGKIVIEKIQRIIVDPRSVDS